MPVLYAQTPLRRGAQVLADVLVLAWVVAWAVVGRAVHAATLALGEPGLVLESGAQGVSRQLGRAGEVAGGVPFVGDELAGPFTAAGQAATGIADAGRRQVEVVGDLAALLGLVVAGIPVLLVVAVWLALRVRFARRASSVRRLLSQGADMRLFALRALVRQPVERIAAVSADPLGGWRGDDDAVVQGLARLELRAAGVRPPAAAAAASPSP